MNFSKYIVTFWKAWRFCRSLPRSQVHFFWTLLQVCWFSRLLQRQRLTIWDWDVSWLYLESEMIEGCYVKRVWGEKWFWGKKSYFNLWCKSSFKAWQEISLTTLSVWFIFANKRGRIVSPLKKQEIGCICVSIFQVQYVEGIIF